LNVPFYTFLQSGLLDCPAFGSPTHHRLRDGRSDLLLRSEPVPEIVKIAAAGQWTFAGHNAAFEQAIDRAVMGPRYGFPIIPDEQIDCTLARCAIMGLPLGLDQACAALKLRYQKDDAGYRLKMKMCKPRAPRKGEPPDALLWHETPEQIARLTEYCIADVRAEIGLGRAMFPMSESEKQVWRLDQRMNNRGVQIDLRHEGKAQRRRIMILPLPPFVTIRYLTFDSHDD
jgi:DNA polymerase bacteriophage-type